MALTDEGVQQLDRVRERKAPLWVAITLFILMGISVVNAVRTRAINDILTGATPIAIILGGLLVLIVVAALIAEPPKVKPRGIIKRIVPGLILLAGVAAGVVAAGAIFYAVGASVSDLYLWVQSDVSGAQAESRLWFGVVATLPLAAAALLFSFRLVFRSIYGLSEAGVGLWVGVQQLYTDSAAAALIVPILTASVYLMVRGFDNVHQGLTKDPKDPIATQAVARLRRPWL